MKAMIALLFLAALAVFARAEMEYHPQAIVHYLELEDREMARKVRHLMKLNDPEGLKPSGLPSIRPSFRPSGLPAVCFLKAVKCHKRAGDDACAHLACIKKTGECLKKTNFKPSEEMKKCFPVIPCCMLYSKSCAERLCCFVRFGECLKKLGDIKDAE